jgi:hypothetical protein
LWRNSAELKEKIMFELEALAYPLSGMTIGGLTGYYASKKFPISKGLSIVVGGILGLAISYKLLDVAAKRKRDLREKVLGHANFTPIKS